MSKPNLKTLMNNIKSNKVHTKNISTNNEYEFSLKNKEKRNDTSIPKIDKLKYKENINGKNIIKNFLTKSIKDTTANLISEDETLVMKSKKIISLMYDKDILSIQ